MANPNDPNDPNNPSNPPILRSAETDQTAKSAEKLAKYFADYATRLEHANEALKEYNDASKTAAENDLAQAEAKQDILKILKELSLEMKKLEELEQEGTISEEQKKRLKDLKKIYDTNVKNLEIEGQSIEEAIKLNKQIQLQKASQIEFANQAANSLTQITGITTHSQTLAGSLFRIAGKDGIGGFVGALQAAKEKAFQLLNPMNIMASIIDTVVMNTVQLAKEQDRAYADFEKQVGNARLYEDAIWDVTFANGQYGLSITDVANATKVLKTQFADMDSFSQATKKGLIETTAQLEKLGINAEDTARSMQILTKGFGMTASQATSFQKQLYGTAKAMGLPPAQVSRDFAAAAPRLAAHGKQMTKVFLDLQKSAQNTGIEFNKLISMTSKFDTFDGAAQAAGELNAILGGDLLNSVELMNADEAERIRLMQDALKMSGKTYDSMSKQEKLAVAQAMGIDDLTELQKLMNNENKKSTVELMNQEEAQKAMNEAIEEAQTLGEMWNTLLGKLSIGIRPLIVALKHIVSGLLAFFDAIDNAADATSKFIGSTESTEKSVSSLSGVFSFFGDIFDSVKAGFDNFAESTIGKVVVGILKFIGSIALIYGAFKLVMAGIRILLGGIGNAFAGFLNSVSGPLGTAIRTVGGSIADVMKRMAQAADKGKVGMLAFGLTMIMVAGAFYILTMALKEFSGISWEDMGKAGVALLAMVGTMVIIDKLKGNLIMGAAALGLMGLSLMVVAMAFNLFNEVDFEKLIYGGIAIGIFAAAITGLGALLSGPGGLLFAVGVAALMGLGLALGVVGLGMMSLGSGLSSLGKGFDQLINVVKNIGDMKDNIDIMLDFVEDLAAIDSDPILELAGALTKLSIAMASISEMKTISVGLDLNTKFDDISRSMDRMAESLSKPIATGVIAALERVSEIIDEISVVKVAALATVTTALTVPTVSTATNAAVATNNAGSAAGRTTAINPANQAPAAAAETKMIPVAIYIDGKKLGEILDPGIRRTIEDKLNKIGGTGRTIPDAR